MQIIAGRLERMVRVKYKTSIDAQNRDQNPNRRRKPTYQRGVVAMSAVIAAKIPPELLARLDALCTAQRVKRSVVIRDALDFYLGMAEQEGVRLVPTTARKKT